MRTKEEIIEIDNNFKTEEDYWSWEERTMMGKLEDRYMIDTFPHSPWLPKYLEYNIKRKKELTGTIFPWREEIFPKDIITTEWEFKAPWVKEKDPVVIRLGYIGHYSSSLKVWEWDWEHIQNGNETQIMEVICNVPDHCLCIIRENLIKAKIQCKLISVEENKIGLRFRLTRKSYLEFRKVLLKLSKENKIRSSYEYEEIRDVIFNSNVNIIC